MGSRAELTREEGPITLEQMVLVGMKRLLPYGADLSLLRSKMGSSAKHGQLWGRPAPSRWLHFRGQQVSAYVKPF